MASAVRPSNPYDFQGEVEEKEQFAGRQEELTAIQRELKKFDNNARASVSLAVVGARRVGKSSLLRRVLEHCSSSGPIAVRVNLDENLLEDSWGFWRLILGELRSAIPMQASHTVARRPMDPDFLPRLSEHRQIELAVDDYKMQESSPGRVPENLVLTDLSNLIHAAHQAGRTGLVVLFDEAQTLLAKPTLQYQLRFIKEQSRIGLVFFGTPETALMFSDSKAPMYLQATVINLRSFTSLADVQECALLPLLPEQRILLDPATTQHLAALSQGKPNQIRLICNAIYNRYEEGDQDDLAISLDALQDTLSKIESQYSAEELRQFTKIKELNPVDLEILYCLTEFPNWTLSEVATLAESFRGEQFSEAALNRRLEALKKKRAEFIARGLLSESDEYCQLNGDEYHALFLRFWYELSKFDKIQKILNFDQRVPTPFTAKVKKLVRAVRFMMRTPSQLTIFNYGDAGETHQQLFAHTRRTFDLIHKVEAGDLGAASNPSLLLHLLQVCQYMFGRRTYCVICATLRDMVDSRQAMNVEIYFAHAGQQVGPLDPKDIMALRSQCEQSKVYLEGIDHIDAELPSIRQLAERVPGQSFESFLGQLPIVGSWRLQAIERILASNEAISQDQLDLQTIPQDESNTSDDNESQKELSWITAYRNHAPELAILDINARLLEAPTRTRQARLYNDLGYINLALRKLDVADSALNRAIALHQTPLSITLLNRAVLSIDRKEWSAAREMLSESLLLINESEEIYAGFLALRMLPGATHHKSTNFEQHPANTIEDAYVNLAYAYAYDGDLEKAQQAIEEGLSILTQSVYLRFASARLHIYSNHADRADSIFIDLSQREIKNSLIASEVELVTRGIRRKLNRAARTRR